MANGCHQLWWVYLCIYLQLRPLFYIIVHWLWCRARIHIYLHIYTHTHSHTHAHCGGHWSARCDDSLVRTWPAIPVSVYNILFFLNFFPQFSFAPENYREGKKWLFGEKQYQQTTRRRDFQKKKIIEKLKWFHNSTLPFMWQLVYIYDDIK